ncbi:hypothetical protein B484DRAFT_392138, partial [Ochromonadaceae sp. CCMP2298]
MAAFHRELFDKWLPKLLKYKELNCVEPVHVPDFTAVVSLCALYDALCKSETSLTRDILGADFNTVCEK